MTEASEARKPQRGLYSFFLLAVIINCMGSSPLLRHPENLASWVRGTFKSLQFRSNAVFLCRLLLCMVWEVWSDTFPATFWKKSFFDKKTTLNTKAIPRWDICTNFNRVNNKIRNVSVSYMSNWTSLATNQAKSPFHCFFSASIFFS